MPFQMRFRMLSTLLLSLIVPAGSASASTKVRDGQDHPIEKLWFKVKAFLRKFKARTLDALPNAIQNAFHSVTVSDCSGWFRFCGYAL